MGVLKEIRSCIRNGLYYLTEHAVTEAEEDLLEIFDIENCVLFGRIKRVWPRERKYEILGKSLDGRTIGVVCRFTAGGKVRVITAYEDRSA